ncbi:MAG: nucleotidyl transferase AbiEii/AbiGii toxin family protein, partial [Acidimicrobiaceae bacterium]|nr:nucleotidyl transferase AbiEii/AbiGii toxin family protein [Acidimicrobiaceae bacterium]
MTDDASAAPLSLTSQPPAPAPAPTATGCVREINSLVADTEVWGEIIEMLTPRFNDSHDTEEMAYKDLYVTEALRCAVVPSEACPQALVVFKGGTSLVKAHKIINRFS